ncbi:MAG: ArgR family transcriptional regulator [Spirochaetales bacterium]|nr:ArgR family transcriptional regulator [Spirochaetales bacterium]
MKERGARLRTIKLIIKDNRIESQEALLEHLQKEGFNVTQATLSRDLKLLKVGKVSDGWHGYFYTLPGGEDSEMESRKRYVQDFKRGFISVEYSGNIGVIRTLLFQSDSVALALDKLGFPEIIGTVAGDDTILIVLRTGITGEDMNRTLRERIPDIDL